MEVCKIKSQLTPEKLCASEKASVLKPFVSSVLLMKFAEGPNYEKLRFILIKGVFELGRTPTK